jgi:hypothetical protein
LKTLAILTAAMLAAVPAVANEWVIGSNLCSDQQAPCLFSAQPQHINWYLVGGQLTVEQLQELNELIVIEEDMTVDPNTIIRIG